MRDSFVFYRSFFEAVLETEDEIEQARIFKAICEYALNEELPVEKGIVSMAFRFVKPQIDANNQRYKNGQKGGRPKTETKPNGNQTETKTAKAKTESKPNVNENVNDNDNVNVNVNDNVNDNELLLRSNNKFIKPTVQQVKAYCIERGNNVDAEQFIDYYEANGWKQGRGKPIKDWKACVRTWERNGFNKPKAGRLDWLDEVRL